MADDLQLSDKDIIEHSKAHPDNVFVSDDGRVVFCGRIYKNEQQLVDTLNMISKPGVTKFLLFIDRVFSRKKKKKAKP